MAKRSFVIFLLVAFLLGLQLLLLSIFNFWNAPHDVIGTKENVVLLSSSEELEVVAKVDTGADISAIDANTVSALGLEPDWTNTRFIRTDMGIEERPTVQIDYILSDKKISSVMTVSDRAGFDTPMLIGKQDTSGFIIDPSNEFLTIPDVQSDTISRLSGSITNATDIETTKLIMIIPILVTIIVVMKLLGGVNTYGVFASVIIALSLMDIGLINGLIIFSLLLVIGIGFNILCLTRLQLPHIVSLSLTVSMLVIALLGIFKLSTVLPLTLSDIFFPLFVTTYAVEQATHIINEYGVRQVVPITLSTVATATVLAIVGASLLGQSYYVLWAMFILSIVTTITVGNYLGLRLNEIIRFKFLRSQYVNR